MNKHTIFGLPLNPTPLLDELRGASFCVSYATRDKLGKQLDQAISLVGDDGILMIDNGAYSIWKKALKAGQDPVEAGKFTMTEEYLLGFGRWASDIMARCPQAIVVIPDVIMGTVEQNCELRALWAGMSLEDGCEHLDTERSMPVWHMDEPLWLLQNMIEGGYTYIAFGSTVAFKPNSPEWHARIREAFAAIDETCTPDSGYCRPRIHMMRAQGQAHLYDFDSSDSTNVSVNHSRQMLKSGMSCPRAHIRAFASRVTGRIQASCDGTDAPHQQKIPLWHLDTVSRELDAKMQAELIAYAIELGRVQITTRNSSTN
jgi:hypothetical protein